MKKVMVFGTFDILHPGHLFYFKKAKELGDYLIAVVSRDSNAEKVKGRKPINDETHRLELIEALKIVDKAILGHEQDFIETIANEKPDLIALGYDQDYLKLEEIRTELKKRNLGIEIKVMGSYKTSTHKASKIKEKIKNDL